MKKKIFIIVGIVFAIIILGIACLYIYAIFATIRTENNLNDKAIIIANQIQKGNLSEDSIKIICRNYPEYRRYFFQNIKGQTKFPSEFSTQFYTAETDLIIWLMHPNELGSKPDSIQFVDTMNFEYNSLNLKYYLFKFKVNEPNWASKYGWMAGVSGPFLSKTELYETVLGTFSELDPISKMSNREHVEYVHNKMIKMGRYNNLK
jgi:hypothetical protein